MKRGRLADALRGIVPWVEPGVGSTLAMLAEKAERLEELVEELLMVCDEVREYFGKHDTPELAAIASLCAKAREVLKNE